MAGDEERKSKEKERKWEKGGEMSKCSLPDVITISGGLKGV